MTILFLSTIQHCIGWKSSLRISYPIKEFTVFSRADEIFSSSSDQIKIPLIPYESMRAIDIGCGEGNSTFYLSKLLQEMYQLSHLDLLGMDPNLQNVHTASIQYPSIEFLYYDFFRYADVDIRPHGIDVIQTSVSQIKKNLYFNVRKINHVLQKQGSLHLYGSIPHDCSWSAHGLQCDLRIPFHSNIEYIILRQLHGNGFIEGIPTILSSFHIK